MENLLTRLEKEESWGKLTVMPQTVFAVDDMDFSSYKELNSCLDVVVKSKLDLITLLHFGHLNEKNRDIFFENAKIDLTDMDTNPVNPTNHREIINNIKAQMSYEAEEGEGTLLDAYNEKKLYKMQLDDYILDYAKKKEKQIPRTEEDQRAYLSQLIDQGFFKVIDNYNSRKERLSKLFYHLSQFNSHGAYSSAYQHRYRNRVLVEAYIKGKLSDNVLQFIVGDWVENAQSNNYEHDIVKFAYTIRLQYPQLSQKILEAVNVYIQSLPERVRDKKYDTTWELAKGK